MNSLRLLIAFTAAGICALAVAGGASAVPAPPFLQCPAIGASPSCAILIEFTDQGINILSDPAVGPYDGIEDTLVGVQNDSSGTVNSVTLSGTGANGIPIFGFDGDGICTFTFVGNGYCATLPAGSSRYEGPNMSFANVSADETTGDVVFTGGLAKNASTFFSLEDRLAPCQVTVISLAPPTASNPVGTSHTVTATITGGAGCASVAGQLVTFSITSGPDTGASGTCVPATCMTDANGQVTFTYTNNGTTGTDTISASFTNAQGNKQIATATKDWTPAGCGPTNAIFGGFNVLSNATLEDPNTHITGNIHSNQAINFSNKSVVVGDASAVKGFTGKGYTVTGTATPFGAVVAVPTLSQVLAAVPPTTTINGNVGINSANAATYNNGVFYVKGNVSIGNVTLHSTFIATGGIDMSAGAHLTAFAGGLAAYGAQHVNASGVITGGVVSSNVNLATGTSIGC